MRVLLFEFICGGGFGGQPLPPSLAQEGHLMLQALLDDFAELDNVSVSVMLDHRICSSIDTKGAKAFVVEPEQDYMAVFMILAKQNDAVWPVAPESGGILQKLCQAVADLGKRLLTAPAEAVALTGDKYQTYLRLRQHGIATVPTWLVSELPKQQGEWIVKPIDGIGCEESQIISDWAAFLLTVAESERFIVQPHLPGRKTSLSGLFRHGQARLLSINLQQFDVIDQRYHLNSIVVNQQCDDGGYQQLLQNLATAFPELWGYGGVDLIEAAHGVLVLEINPRLTTSFAGLRTALGVNIAWLVLRLQYAMPEIQFTHNQAVRLSL